MKEFMFLLRGGDSVKEMSPEEMQQHMGKYFAWIEQLSRQGHFKGGLPLAREGAVLSGEKGSMVTDGPYVEGKEAVGGYFMIVADSLEEATDVARGCPILLVDGSVEVRQIRPLVDAAADAGPASAEA